MINYKTAIYKKLIHHNGNHLKLHLRYIQDLLTVQELNKPKGSISEVIEQKSQTQKVLITPKSNFE